MHLNPSSRNLLWASAHAFVFLLLIVWQIPNTIGLRYGLLGLLLPIALLLLFWRSPSHESLEGIRWAPLVWLMVLTGWIVVVIQFWGQDPGVSWGEFRGQWLSALAAGFVGFLLAHAAIKDSKSAIQKLVMVVFWSFLAQVLMHDILGALYWISTDIVPFRQAPVFYMPDMVLALANGLPWYEAFSGYGTDKFSYVNNVLAALLVAGLAQRILTSGGWLACSNLVLGVAFAAMLLCSYWLNMRNGNVGLLLLLMLAALMMALRLISRFGPVRVLFGVGLVIATISALGVVMVESDPRWQKLSDTVPIALDTETNRTWLTMDQNYPKMANGEMVDASAYERLAWAKEGAKLVIDNPWGTGYNRLAYGAGIDRKYQMDGTYRAHSHSGIIDFTIANGLVGLALWLGFLGALFYVGWQTFRGEQIGLGLALMFLISGFLGRSIVDSNIRDHVLQQFFFLAMLFYGLSANSRRRPIA